jgi:hypothetical protein
VPTNYNNIPAELRALKQWVLYKNFERESGGFTKVPIQSLNGQKASVTSPNHWSTFEDALANVERADGLGFVFSEDDPFAGIDLDATNDPECRAIHTNVWNHIPSYTERSPSGNGYHIIVRGSVPTGKRKKKTEVYSSARFFTVTGDVVRDLPILDHQDNLDILWAEMGGKVEPYTETEDGEQLRSDDDLILIGAKAANGEKFMRLANGDFSSYASQSEADQAWANMLSYYTDSKTQVARIFLASPLGQRDKAHKHPSYLRNTIRKAFDQKLPKVDIRAVESALAELVQKPKKQTGPLVVPIEWPNGLIGEVAKFVYQQSPRPIEDIALVSALGLMAGICGQAYNISGSGLNMYIVLVAGTGRGKEAMASGVEKLMTHVIKLVPDAERFLGPSDMASGAGLINWMENSSCFVSIMGEIGHRLKAICSDTAPSHERDLKALLLNLYGKSGAESVLRAKAYSSASKSKNEHKAVLRPSFTLVGESTPERFFEALDDNLVTDGFLPRFLIVQYDGERKYMVKEHSLAAPDKMLVARLAELVTHCRSTAEGGRVQVIKYDPIAEEMLDAFDRKTTDLMNEPGTKSTLNELYNRAHMKALRLAGLLAVSENYLFPTVSPAMAEWAIGMVMRDVNNMIFRFTSGETGVRRDGNQMRHVEVVTKIIKDWISDPAKAATYGTDVKMIKEGVFSVSSLNIRLQGVKIFKNDKFGVPDAIKKALRIMEDDGSIQEMNKAATKDRFGKTALCYQIVDVDKFK